MRKIIAIFATLAMLCAVLTPCLKAKLAANHTRGVVGIRHVGMRRHDVAHCVAARILHYQFVLSRLYLAPHRVWLEQLDAEDHGVHAPRSGKELERRDLLLDEALRPAPPLTIRQVLPTHMKSSPGFHTFAFSM